jgi:hypothetical protein
MAILAASLKWFQCTTWTEGATHGGAVNTSVQITTGVSQNIFDNVTDAERQSGITMYRKVFFRNENADAYNNVKAWIQANTPDTQTAVSVTGAGSVSVQGSDTVIPTTTFTFAASVTVTASADCHLQVAEGERIWNSTNDTSAAARIIASISSDGLTITLTAAYAGTTGAAKQGTVGRADANTFVSPDTEVHADVLNLGNLVQNASIGIWVKLVVNSSADGYTDDTFTLRTTNS